MLIFFPFGIEVFLYNHQKAQPHNSYYSEIKISKIFLKRPVINLCVKEETIMEIMIILN
jgi:hypothetical protein